MNMGNLAYALPGHRSPAPAFEQHHMHHYPQAQGIMYPIHSMSHYPAQTPAGAVPYGVPYVPAYGPYPMPQPVGPIQHGTQYTPYAGPLQNMSGPPSYGAGYYHPSYASYRSTTYPMDIQSRQPSQQGRGSSSTSPSKKDVDKQAEAEYDVSKTIVDGSNPVKSGVSSGKSKSTLFKLGPSVSLKTNSCKMELPLIQHPHPRIHHEDHHENPNNPVTPSGSEIFHLEQV